MLDMGCGGGIAANAVAAAFPGAVVHGLDPDGVAIGVARKAAAARGLRNVRFFEGAGEDFRPPGGVLYDFAMCLDIVHDCAFPDKVRTYVRARVLCAWCAPRANSSPIQLQCSTGMM